MLYRRMEERDIDKVAALENACFSQPWSADAFRKTLENPDIVYMIVEDGENIIANGGLRDIVGEGEITNVAVAKEYRGQGIATKLMTCILECGDKMGITAYTLEVRAGNIPAIRLYEHHGFRTEGVRRNFYSNPVEDAYIMWKRV